jgi:hypothetical protein
MMKFSLIRFLKERRLRREFEPLRARLQEELSQALQQPCQLLPAAGKGGYDRLFYVETKGQRIAMMRVKNNQAGEASPSPAEALRRTLTADERLDYEWAAYTALSQKRLSPQPLWRSQEAIVASYHPFPRASEILKADEQTVWTLLPHLFALVRDMHAAQLVHMDLNLGNILVDPETHEMMAIDFEYAPASTLSFEQACLCDYCRLINDLLRPRRGGRAIQKDFDRFTELLRRALPQGINRENVACIQDYFPMIKRDTKVLRALESCCCSPTL